jgi:glyoxylase-like metal-dependent hydrolase (beta-lactamase superfamily II)
MKTTPDRTEVTEGSLVRLAAHSWCVESTPLGSSNAGIVVGRRATLVVDSRLTPELARELTVLARSLSSDPESPIYLVNTHCHMDHCFGNDAFDMQLAIATEWTCRTLDERWEREAERFMGFRRSQAESFRRATKAVPGMRLTGALHIDLGGVTAALRPVGAAHTPGDLIVEVPGDDVTFVGDLVFHGHWPVLSDANLDGWLAALSELAAARPGKVCPGHGPAGDAGLLDEMSRCLTLLARLAAYPGEDPEDAAARSEFAAWEHADRVAPAVEQVRHAHQTTGHS